MHAYTREDARQSHGHAHAHHVPTDIRRLMQTYMDKRTQKRAYAHPDTNAKRDMCMHAVGQMKQASCTGMSTPNSRTQKFRRHELMLGHKNIHTPISPSLPPCLPPSPSTHRLGNKQTNALHNECLAYLLQSYNFLLLQDLHRKMPARGFVQAQPHAPKRSRPQCIEKLEVIRLGHPGAYVQVSSR